VLIRVPMVDGRITLEQLAYGLLTTGQSAALRVLTELGRIRPRWRTGSGHRPNPTRNPSPPSPSCVRWRRNQSEKWGVEPELLFPPDIRKLNTLNAQAREIKWKVVDAERYDLASTIRAREEVAAMRRRAELLTEWAGEAEVVAMVEEIERLRAQVRRLSS
jgi:hypothetical protein